LKIVRVFATLAARIKFYLQGGPKKSRQFLRVDNFEIVNGRKVCPKIYVLLLNSA